MAELADAADSKLASIIHMPATMERWTAGLCHFRWTEGRARHACAEPALRAAAAQAQRARLDRRERRDIS